MHDKNEVAMTNDNGAALFTWPSDRPKLIGSKCKKCDEVVFPARLQCPKCYAETMEETQLSTIGKVYSFTISYLAPWTMYEGTVPYAFGHVELPEKVLIPCRFSSELKSGEIPPLPIGTEVKLAIEEWGVDEKDKDNMVMMHTFKALKRKDVTGKKE